MAGQNKVFLIGRLTRDPEVRIFSGGGSVARFGLAVPERFKKDDDGKFSEVVCFLEVEAFNSEKGRKHADFAERFLRKGGQISIEGHLKLDQWTDNSGGKKSMIKVVVDDFVLLGNKEQNVGGGSGSLPDKSKKDDASDPPPPGGDEDDSVPF